jgi:hypothetical protein
MRLERTAAFDDESVRFQLCYTCEECAHFDASTDGCAHEWPSELHRRTRALELLPALIDFCKEFELC